jgi:hypothetical protein
MPPPPRAFKLYHVFTCLRHPLPAGEGLPGVGREAPMVALAVAIFIAVFGWGASYFGWHDPEGKVQLALATTFVLGAVAGYKSKD